MSTSKLTNDGVQAELLTTAQIQQLLRARDEFSTMEVPGLLSSARDRLFVAALDGTGNSLHRDSPHGLSVIANLTNDIAALKHPAIVGDYVEGVGTQDDFYSRVKDGATAYTFSPRVEEMYFKFCQQAARWRDEDPDARIRVLAVGFSRGAEAAAALQVMIHERGIRDPRGARLSHDGEGRIRDIAWADRPLLEPPGATPQASVLIDPVSEGIEHIDRRLPPSNIGALQFTSIAEPRDHFSSTTHLLPGVSADKRFANIDLPGAHSDLGETYLLDGTGRVVRNMLYRYVNTALGDDLLRLVPEHRDPRMYVSHNSAQHLGGVWPTTLYEGDGSRVRHTRLGPSCEPVAPRRCERHAPDEQLGAGIGFMPVRAGQVQTRPDAKMKAALATVEGVHQPLPDVWERVAGLYRAGRQAGEIAMKDFVGDQFNRLFTASRDQDALRAFTRVLAAGPIFGTVRVAQEALDRQDPRSDVLHPPVTADLVAQPSMGRP